MLDSALESILSAESHFDTSLTRLEAAAASSIPKDLWFHSVCLWYGLGTCRDRLRAASHWEQLELQGWKPAQAAALYYRKVIQRLRNVPKERRAPKLTSDERKLCASIFAAAAGTAASDVLGKTVATPPESLRELESFINWDTVDLPSLNWLGRIFDQDGLQVAGRFLYSRAASRGFLPALFNLGSCYEEGTGVEKSEPTAISVYEEAGRRGEPDAYFNIALIYHSKVPPQGLKAAGYYEKCVEMGEVEAIVNLSSLYHGGESDVPKDTEKSVDILLRVLDINLEGDMDVVVVRRAHQRLMNLLSEDNVIFTRSGALEHGARTFVRLVLLDRPLASRSKRVTRTFLKHLAFAEQDRDVANFFGALNWWGGVERLSDEAWSHIFTLVEVAMSRKSSAKPSLLPTSCLSSDFWSGHRPFRQDIESILFRVGMTQSPGDGRTLCWRIGHVGEQHCPKLKNCRLRVLQAYQKYLAAVELVLLCSRTIANPENSFRMLPPELVEAIVSRLLVENWRLA